MPSRCRGTPRGLLVAGALFHGHNAAGVDIDVDIDVDVDLDLDLGRDNNDEHRSSHHGNDRDADAYRGRVLFANEEHQL